MHGCQILPSSCRELHHASSECDSMVPMCLRLWREKGRLWVCAGGMGALADIPDRIREEGRDSKLWDRYPRPDLLLLFHTILGRCRYPETFHPSQLLSKLYLDFPPTYSATSSSFECRHQAVFPLTKIVLPSAPGQASRMKPKNTSLFSSNSPQCLSPFSHSTQEG